MGIASLPNTSKTMTSATMTNDEVLAELQDMKTKVYLPSSFAEVASRFAELVTNNLNDDTRDAFFGDVCFCHSALQLSIIDSELQRCLRLDPRTWARRNSLT